VNIAGTGIATFECQTLPGFRVITNLAIQWQQLSSGNWKGTDRGAATDIYGAQISVYARETTINNFITQIEAGRVSGNNQITLSDFATNEHIFGENVKHTGSITATILNMPQRSQGSLTGYGLTEIFIRAQFDPSDANNFTGSTSMPTLRYYEPAGSLDADRTISKIDSYTSTFSYLDHRADSGTFEGVFTFTNADFILLRNYIRATRTGDFTLADTFGVSYPFGPRSSHSYPFTVKLIEWEDLGFFGLLHHKMRFKFAESF
jgi:hypothetical protein